MSNNAVALAITGASGANYALVLLEKLLKAGETVYLMISPAGRMVLEQEVDLRLPSRPAEIRSLLLERIGTTPGNLQVFGREDWNAPIASGSNPPRAMVVCPCTAGTLAAVAAGQSRSLIERAADVVLKERRLLILVPRETPYSVIHLENMLRLARAGALILPANPGFYHRPTTVEGVVDFVVGRSRDQLEIEHGRGHRWGADSSGD